MNYLSYQDLVIDQWITDGKNIYEVIRIDLQDNIFKGLELQRINLDPETADGLEPQGYYLSGDPFYMTANSFYRTRLEIL